MDFFTFLFFQLFNDLKAIFQPFEYFFIPFPNFPILLIYSLDFPHILDCVFGFFITAATSMSYQGLFILFLKFQETFLLFQVLLNFPNIFRFLTEFSPFSIVFEFFLTFLSSIPTCRYFSVWSRLVYCCNDKLSDLIGV